MEEDTSLTTHQQRILRLLFKFRFITAGTLADILDTRRSSVYSVLERLVEKGYVKKVYEKTFRIDHKPAYYYLTKTGTTTVRKLMGSSEVAVHALYKNDEASGAFIEQCLELARLYVVLRAQFPEHTDIFSRTELSRFRQFPKNRPDFYLRTDNGTEAFLILATELEPYRVWKRFDEIIAHYEEEGWEGQYPSVGFIFTDDTTKRHFLYGARKKLDSLGFDDDELTVLATSLPFLAKSAQGMAWSSSRHPLVSRGV